MTWTRPLRRLANKAIDAAFITKSPARLQNTVVILHGASCSGKSFVLRHLMRTYTGCTYVEMDTLQYWKVKPDPNILNVAQRLLNDAGVERDKSKALIRSMRQSHQVPERNYSPYPTMVELLKAFLASDAVIATCGNLPPPHGDYAYYSLLGQCTGKLILHVLVAPENAVLAKRIRSRGQTALIGKHTASNDWRLQNREFYDLILTGNEPTARILELICTSIEQVRASSP